MPLSWNDIKHKALAFSKRWSDASREDAEAKPFWIDFFDIFGLSDKRVAFLFDLYQRLTSLLPGSKPAKPRPALRRKP